VKNTTIKLQQIQILFGWFHDAHNSRGNMFITMASQCLSIIVFYREASAYKPFCSSELRYKCSHYKYNKVYMLIDWLVFYGTSTQDRSICANLPGGILAQTFEDSQRGTYKNIQFDLIQWTYTCNDKQVYKLKVFSKLHRTYVIHKIVFS